MSLSKLLDRALVAARYSAIDLEQGRGRGLPGELGCPFAAATAHVVAHVRVQRQQLEGRGELLRVVRIDLEPGVPNHLGQ